MLLSCGKQEATYTEMSMQDALLKMQNETNYVLVDVRSEDEYNSGHIPNAICIPNEKIKEEVKELPDKKQMIFIYCRSGNRSKQAASKLVQLGYTNVYEIGGIMEYSGEIE